MRSFNRGNTEGTNSSKICVWCLCMYVLCLRSDWFCGLAWQRVDNYICEKSLEMCICLWPEFDCPEVTLCGWQDIKIQLLLLSMKDVLPGCLFALVVIKCFMTGVNVWWVYLAPQNIPRAMNVLTLGNTVILYCIIVVLAKPERQIVQRVNPSFGTFCQHVVTTRAGVTKRAPPHPPPLPPYLLRTKDVRPSARTGEDSSSSQREEELAIGVSSISTDCTDAF